MANFGDSKDRLRYSTSYLCLPSYPHLPGELIWSLLRHFLAEVVP